jgi:hypothetical protein
MHIKPVGLMFAVFYLLEIGIQELFDRPHQCGVGSDQNIFSSQCILANNHCLPMISDLLLQERLVQIYSNNTTYS